MEKDSFSDFPITWKCFGDKSLFARHLHSIQNPKKDWMKISNTELGKMVRKILSDWMTLIQYKLEGFDPPTISTSYYSKERKIKLTLDEGETIYDIRERTIEGGDGDIVEDLRDYLRRRGIKFYTDKGFRSI